MANGTTRGSSSANMHRRLGTGPPRFSTAACWITEKARSAWHESCMNCGEDEHYMHVGVRERQRTLGRASRAGGRALVDTRSPLGASVRGHEVAAGEPRDRRTAQCCGARCQRRHHGGELGAVPRSSIGGYLGSEGVRPAFVTQSADVGLPSGFLKRIRTTASAPASARK